MKINIEKLPLYENDDYLIKISDVNLTQENIDKYISDPYVKLKFEKFQNLDITFNGFENFKNKTSLMYSSVTEFNSSIYTYTSQERNNLKYIDIINNINELREINLKSRRIVLRFANSFEEYYKSEFDKTIDVSCLNLIQYYNNEVKIVFRASDIKDELFLDFLTIYWFFIKPIFKNENCNISIYAMTAQNINTIDEFKNKTTKLKD